MKVAAIYTVPYEQQWVSRIHKALKAAEARGEIATAIAAAAVRRRRAALPGYLMLPYALSILALVLLARRAA